MKILCVFGEHNYGDPSRGECYEHANFLPALSALGHQVVFFESFSRAAYLDFADLNQRFLEKVQAENPDIILCVLLGYEIWLETLELVREGCNAVIINWSERDGYANFVLTQWAASTQNLIEPLPAEKCQYRISFIGTAYGNRSKWISGLEDRGIRVECFGHGWKNGPVRSEEIPRIMRESVISLNFGDSGMVMRGLVPGRSRQIKARVFEVTGAGGFLMTENAESLDRFYQAGKEIAVYEGIPDLVDKITYFLSHVEERDRIAMAGHLRTREEHTYELRFQNLLKIASRIRTARGAGQCEVDFGKFGAILRKHETGFLLSLVRFALLVPFMTVWGRKRGVRAARRFLFEISWRMVGKKTYSVSGLPGRLFYRES